MIKFENFDIWGFDHALRGMRNPLESWEKSDSHYTYQEYENDYEGYFDNEGRFKCFTGKGSGDYIIGPYDLALAQRLIQAGPEHRKFLRQIMVSVDITAPLYWWKEFDTYKVGTVANSSSTMHLIHTRPITLDDFSCEHLLKQKDLKDSEGLISFEDLIIYDTGKEDYGWSEDDYRYEDEYYGDPAIYTWAEQILKITIAGLNFYREKYVETKDRKYWWQIIQLLPSSYNQRRTVTLNYENLRSMYFQRRNHKLDEWRIGFCSWVECLPYSEELIMFDPKEDEDGAS